MSGLSIAADIAGILLAMTTLGVWLTASTQHYFRRMDRRFKDQLDRLDSRVNRIHQHLNRLDGNINMMALGFSQLLPSLGIKEGHDMRDVIGDLQTLSTSIVRDSILLETALQNPLSEEDLNRLRQYHDVLAEGHLLSENQARDMQILAGRMKADHPDEPIFNSLLIAAALLLTLAILSRQ